VLFVLRTDSTYVSVEDVHVNGKLTLGENVADLGGEILAYMAGRMPPKTRTFNLSMASRPSNASS
jgi:predicted metalloendopeptidase